MSIIFIDGFDAYGATNNVTPSGMARKWTDGSISSFMRVRDGRISGKAVSLDPANFCGVSLPATQTLICGFGFKAAFAIAAESRICEFLDGSNVGINLRRQTSGEWSIYFDTTHLATTSGQVLPVDTWATVELRVKVDNSAGEYELRVNGITLLSATGIDTQPASNAYTNAIRIVGSNILGVQFHFDDFYVLDESGATNNDFLGSFKVQTTFPNGDGAVDCTPSTGTDNYALVDDNPANDDTDYVTGAASDIDLYDHQNLVNVSQVFAVTVNTVCRQTDASPLDVKLLAKSGTTTGEGSAQTIGSTDYVQKSEIFETNPDTTGPWTPSEVDRRHNSVSRSNSAVQQSHKHGLLHHDCPQLASASWGFSCAEPENHKKQGHYHADCGCHESAPPLRRFVALDSREGGRNVGSGGKVHF